jgi:hypothetical protein
MSRVEEFRRRLSNRVYQAQAVTDGMDTTNISNQVSRLILNRSFNFLNYHVYINPLAEPTNTIQERPATESQLARSSCNHLSLQR